MADTLLLYISVAYLQYKWQIYFDICDVDRNGVVDMKDAKQTAESFVKIYKLTPREV